MAFGLAAIGIVIGANNLAVSLALGSLGEMRRFWRIVVVFALFEFVVPLAGMLIGRRAASAVEDYAAWFGPLLIAAIGMWTIVAVLKRDIDEHALARRTTTWRGLALLATALSLDNLVIGFSLGLGDREPFSVAAVIAVCSASFTWLGLRTGRFARRRSRKIVEAGSGLLLLALAAAIAMDWL